MDRLPPSKILVCVPVIPWPATDGLRVRIFNLARELATRHEVHMFCLSTTPLEAAQRQAFVEAGIALTVVRKPPMPVITKIITYIKSLLSGVPPELILSWEGIAFARLRELHQQHRFDAVVAEHLFMARYALKLECPRLQVEENIEGALMAALALRERLPKRWLKRATAAWIASSEKKMLARMQAIAAVTEEDAAAFGQLAPGVPVVLVKNGVRVADFPAELDHGPAGHNLLFVGLMSYRANVEAVEWFVRRVLPDIRERFPDVAFTIAGKDPLPEVKALDSLSGIDVTGFVVDVRPYYRQAAVMIVPLLMGGGSRLKILESFAAGTPVVSTAKGAEGLEATSGEHLLIADEPADFAAAVVKLFEDRELYSRLQQKARRLAEEKYDWSILARNLESAIAAAIRQEGVRTA